MECPDDGSRFQTLQSAYDEKHRHYHTAQHIQECLSTFDQVRDLADDASEVEFALWLHDVVYKTRASDNEEESAKLAVAWLNECGAHRSRRDRVEQLILATRHQGEPATGDEALLIDVDLHVLGADADRYSEYEAQVRREYRWVPRRIFARRRAELLETFLERDWLFHTDWFRERLEPRARENVEKAVFRLRGMSRGPGELGERRS